MLESRRGAWDDCGGLDAGVGVLRRKLGTTATSRRPGRPTGCCGAPSTSTPTTSATGSGSVACPVTRVPRERTHDVLTAAGVLAAALAMAAPASGLPDGRRMPATTGSRPASTASPTGPHEVGRPASRPLGVATAPRPQLEDPRHQRGLELVLRELPGLLDPGLRLVRRRHPTTARSTGSSRRTRVGATTLLTLPAAGWVAKAISYTGDQLCSYPRRPSTRRTTTTLQTPPAARDSATVRGSRPAPTPPTPWHARRRRLRQWVEHLASTYGSAADGGVGIYAIVGRRAVVGLPPRLPPGPAGYDELWSTSRRSRPR